MADNPFAVDFGPVSRGLSEMMAAQTHRESLALQRERHTAELMLDMQRAELERMQRLQEMELKRQDAEEKRRTAEEKRKTEAHRRAASPAAGREVARMRGEPTDVANPPKGGLDVGGGWQMYRSGLTAPPPMPQGGLAGPAGMPDQFDTTGLAAPPELRSFGWGGIAPVGLAAPPRPAYESPVDVPTSPNVMDAPVWDAPGATVMQDQARLWRDDPAVADILLKSFDAQRKSANTLRGAEMRSESTKYGHDIRMRIAELKRKAGRKGSAGLSKDDKWLLQFFGGQLRGEESNHTQQLSELDRKLKEYMPVKNAMGQLVEPTADAKTQREAIQTQMTALQGRYNTDIKPLREQVDEIASVALTKRGVKVVPRGGKKDPVVSPPAGRIRVRLKDSQQTGTIEAGEFDPKKHERV